MQLILKNIFHITAKENLIQVNNKSLKYHLFYRLFLVQRVRDVSIWRVFCRPIVFYC